ncbi:hypothetical protein DFP72DRAFT_910029, partial [Ephemerocybe angulata]
FTTTAQPLHRRCTQARLLALYILSIPFKSTHGSVPLSSRGYGKTTGELDWTRGIRTRAGTGCGGRASRDVRKIYRGASVDFCIARMLSRENVSAHVYRVIRALP